MKLVYWYRLKQILTQGISRKLQTNYVYSMFKWTLPSSNAGWHASMNHLDKITTGYFLVAMVTGTTSKILLLIFLLASQSEINPHKCIYVFHWVEFWTSAEIPPPSETRGRWGCCYPGYSHVHNHRADSRLASCQWETSLQSNAVSHWLGTNLELALNHHSYGKARNMVALMWHLSVQAMVLYFHVFRCKEQALVSI